MNAVRAHPQAGPAALGQGSPPNHLLQSQVFRRVGSNAIVKILPSDKVSFTGFQPNEPMKKVVKVLNISSQRQRFHIIPPQSEYFTIEYTKFDGPHVPGTSLPITVTLHPIAWKTYNDAIRIHCPEPNDNLIIPLHAYPSVDTARFPARMDFRDIKLGGRVTKSFTIWSKSNTDMSFCATLKETDCFRVTPAGNGTIPAGNSVEFKVTYTPKEYCTKMTNLRLQIFGADSSNPIPALLCAISGNCKVKEMPEEEISSTRSQRKPRPPVSVKSSSGSRKGSARSLATTGANSSASESAARKKQPKHTNPSTQHGVNQLLLHGVHGSSQFTTHSFQKIENAQVQDYQEGEAEFLQQLQKNENLDRSCRVKWVKRLGNSAVKNTAEIMADRVTQSQRVECYHENREQAFCKYYQGRVPRVANTLISIDEQNTTFNIYDRNNWWRRRDILKKFKNAALIILTRIRADKVLKKLRLAKSNAFLPKLGFEQSEESMRASKIRFSDVLDYREEEDVGAIRSRLFDHFMIPMVAGVEQEVAAVDEHQLMTFKDNTKHTHVSMSGYYDDHLYEEHEEMSINEAEMLQDFKFTCIDGTRVEQWMDEKDRQYRGTASELFISMMDRTRDQFVSRVTSRESSARMRASKKAKSETPSIAMDELSD